MNEGIKYFMGNSICKYILEASGREEIEDNDRISEEKGQREILKDVYYGKTVRGLESVFQIFL